MAVVGANYRHRHSWLAQPHRQQQAALCCLPRFAAKQSRPSLAPSAAIHTNNSSQVPSDNCSTSIQIAAATNAAGRRNTSSSQQPPAAYQQLPESFWDERRVLYNHMRHERDRANRRARLKELRAVEEAKLASMPVEARAAYEEEMTALRVAAARQQKAALAHALQHGLRVVIDCSYCLHEGITSSSRSRQQEHQQQIGMSQANAHGMTEPFAACTKTASGNSSRSRSRSSNSSTTTTAVATANVANCTSKSSEFADSSRWSSSSSSNSSSSNGSESPQVKVQKAAWQRGSDSSHEVRSLAKQIELSVSLNRRSSQPVALTVTSFTGNLETFALHLGAASWPINKYTEHVLDLPGITPEQLVLLSPDADTPLLQLQQDKVYVIGGIVDRSVCKGLTAGFGARHCLETVRLPVAEFAAELGLGFAGASTRPVLNVSDVVVALTEFQRTEDWVQALTAAVPARKRRGPTAKQQQQQQQQQQPR